MDKDDAKTWSMKLGFKGELSDEFFVKWASVTTVRKRIIIDLKYSIFAAISFSAIIVYMYFLQGTALFGDFISIFVWAFFLVCIFSVIGHTRVVYQYRKHDKEMIEEWEQKKMNTIQDMLED